VATSYGLDHHAGIAQIPYGTCKATIVFQSDGEQGYGCAHPIAHNLEPTTCRRSPDDPNLTFGVPTQRADPLIVGIDETLERRWGKKIAAKGVYRYLRFVPPTKPSSRAAYSKVGVRDVVGGDPLGYSGMGLALP
jgi:hypothetical protein